MKIELEDKDIDKIAKAVASAMGAKPGPKKPAAEVADEADAETDAETGDEATAEESFEDEGEAGATVDRDDVLAKLKAVTKASSQADAMALLKKVGGVAKLSQLDEDKFATVIAACDKALKAAKKK